MFDIFARAESALNAISGCSTGLQSFISEVREAIPGSHIALVTYARRDKRGKPLPETVTLAGFDQRDLASYLHHFHTLNPFDAQFFGAPRRRPIRSEALISPAQYRETEFYRDWARHTDAMEAGIGLPLGNKSGVHSVLTINFGTGSSTPDYEKLEKWLHRIAPSLEAAMADHRLMCMTPTGFPILLDSLATPAFMLGADARILVANPAGEKLLREATLLRSKDGVMTLVSIDAQTAFDSRLTSMRIGSKPDPLPVILPRPTGSPAAMRLMPVAGSFDPSPNARSDWGVLSTLRIFAMIVDPDVAPQPPVELLRRMYGLTAAESAVALAIASGATLEEYSESAQVSVLTARNQLRSASDKMGARRQAEVVSRVLRLGLAMNAV